MKWILAKIAVALGVALLQTLFVQGGVFLAFKAYALNGSPVKWGLGWGLTLSYYFAIFVAVCFAANLLVLFSPRKQVNNAGSVLLFAGLLLFLAAPAQMYPYRVACVAGISLIAYVSGLRLVIKERRKIQSRLAGKPGASSPEGSA